MDGHLDQEELEAAHCWERDDRVPRQPELTEFRRAARYHQAQWRETNGHPIGTQPMNPKPNGKSRLVGSRLPLAYALETGASFVTAHALNAVTARSDVKEPHQSWDAQGLWADLLSSTALAFNLFGDLAADEGRADRAVHAWWPDVPGTASDLRFVHSPGRFDLDFTGNLIALDAAVALDLDDGSQGVLGIDVKYHERPKREIPKPIRLARYLEVHEASGVFAPDAVDAVNGTDLTVMWLEHLLVLSMLQHPSEMWSWGRYVVVHPAGNVGYAEACARYRDLLVDQSTFTSVTLETLLEAKALPPKTTAALRKRYVVA